MVNFFVWVMVNSIDCGFVLQRRFVRICKRQKTKRAYMTNGNWVCFDCRTSQRRSCWRFATYFQPWIVGSIGNGSILCPDCERPCRFLGHRIAVPPKRDDNGWKQLRQYIDERRDFNCDRKAQLDTRRKHELEKRIAELHRRPENKERDGLINRLLDELESIKSN